MTNMFMVLLHDIPGRWTRIPDAHRDNNACLFNLEVPRLFIIFIRIELVNIQIFNLCKILKLSNEPSKYDKQ